MSLTIVIANYELIRRGILSLLRKELDCEILGECIESEELIELVSSHQPSVAILDLGVPGVDGPEIAKRIHAASPNTRVIILSGRPEETSVRQLLEAGVAGFVLRMGSASELIEAVRITTSDGVYISPSIVPLLEQSDDFKSSNKQRDSTDVWLSPRQKEVLRLIAEGYSSKQIAQNLNISESTVKSHRKNIMERLDIHDKVALTRYALRIGLIQTN